MHLDKTGRSLPSLLREQFMTSSNMDLRGIFDRLTLTRDRILNKATNQYESSYDRGSTKHSQTSSLEEVEGLIGAEDGLDDGGKSEASEDDLLLNGLKVARDILLAEGLVGSHT